MPVAIKDISSGAMIRFRSKNPTDTVDWRGILEVPQGTYRSIQSYRDPRSYNEAVRQIDPSVPSDVTALHYFVITVDNDSTQPTTLAFAAEWILPGSLVELTVGKQITVIIDDPNNDPQRLLSILAEAGYICRISN